MAIARVRTGPLACRSAAASVSRPPCCTGPWSSAMVRNRTTPDHAGRFAYDGLDRVIHEKARLGIVSSLATHAGGLLFNDLTQLCALPAGNLRRHLQILVEAGLI